MYTNKSSIQDRGIMRSKIKELAAIKGMSLYRLAREVGITDRALYRYERNGLDNAKFGFMAKIAKVLDCRIEDLFEE